MFDADAAFKGGETPDLTDEASLARAVLQPGNKLLAVSKSIVYYGTAWIMLCAYFRAINC